MPTLPEVDLCHKSGWTLTTTEYVLESERMERKYPLGPDGELLRTAPPEPATLAEVVDHEALAYRARRTPEGDLLASHVEELARLIRYTGASTPQELEERIEVLEMVR